MKVGFVKATALLLGTITWSHADTDANATRLFDGLSPAKRIEISATEESTVDVTFGYLLENGTFLSIGCIKCKIQSLGDPCTVRKLNNEYVISESDYHALIHCMENANVEFRVGNEVFSIWHVNYVKIFPNVVSWKAKVPTG